MKIKIMLKIIMTKHDKSIKSMEIINNNNIHDNSR